MENIYEVFNLFRLHLIYSFANKDVGFSKVFVSKIIAPNISHVQPYFLNFLYQYRISKRKDDQEL
jgi:hypothetical protein